jgi:hypothetical protein
VGKPTTAQPGGFVLAVLYSALLASALAQPVPQVPRTQYYMYHGGQLMPFDPKDERYRQPDHWELWYFVQGVQPNERGEGRWKTEWGKTAEEVMDQWDTAKRADQAYYRDCNCQRKDKNVVDNVLGPIAVFHGNYAAEIGPHPRLPVALSTRMVVVKDEYHRWNEVITDLLGERLMADAISASRRKSVAQSYGQLLNDDLQELAGHVNQAETLSKQTSSRSNDLANELDLAEQALIKMNADYHRFQKDIYNIEDPNI